MATFHSAVEFAGLGKHSEPKCHEADDSYQPQFSALVAKSMTPLSQDDIEAMPSLMDPVGNRGTRSADFCSILFERSRDRTTEEQFEASEFFRDLNLDQIVDAITAGRDEYDLKPFFYMRLSDLSAIAYRHEVMRDLENEVLFERIKSFSSQIRKAREHLAIAAKVFYNYEKEGWFLEAVGIYCSAAEKLLHDLRECDPKSRGLLGFRDYLAQYVGSGVSGIPLSDYVTSLSLSASNKKLSVMN